MNGKKNLTARQASKFLKRLDLSILEKNIFAQELVGQRLIDLVPAAQQDLAEDEFRLISDWYHFAILTLGHIPNRANAVWIAEQLGIKATVAREAFSRLQRLGLVRIVKGQFRQSSKPLTIKSEVPSAAIRKYHLQNLQLAAEKLERVPLKEREFSSITMAIRPEQMMKAKKMIEEFKQRLCNELESAGRPLQVYTLAIQMFPITKGSK
jgi:uncharacterized protein (TIGR02147 family)